MSNQLKMIFKSEDIENVFIDMDDNKIISKSIFTIFKDPELNTQISKLVYPSKMPSTKKPLLQFVEGLCETLNIPFEESKVDIWESNGFGASLITEEIWLSVEYTSIRKVDITTDDKKAKYLKLYKMATELKEYAKQLKTDKVIGTELNWYFKSIHSDAKKTKK